MIKLAKLTSEEADILQKYFLENDKCIFEGCWLRNQRPENAKKSGYIDETTQRRRYIHFYISYALTTTNNENFLTLKDFYYYVSNTLLQDEINDYEKRINDALHYGNYKQEDGYFINDDIQVIINKYKNHPQNTSKFPDNYSSMDVVVCNKNNDYSKIQERMWNLSRKMYRMPEKRENPTYINVKELIKYLPAQIEMGCGPSIDANIPPLHVMHETYKVQNHQTGHFYFASEDDLMENIIKNPQKMFEKFSSTILACIRANITEGYKDFNKLYKKGYFKGVVFNNNFDKIMRRFDIPEILLRRYDINQYIQKANFEKDVKSLICIGCHADRRQIQKQARQAGLKVIFIDPEGFMENGQFVSYPIEAPKNEDLILKMTFEDAMKKLCKQLKVK